MFNNKIKNLNQNETYGNSNNSDLIFEKPPGKAERKLNIKRRQHRKTFVKVFINHGL